jgi:hypothetical protein
MGSGTSDIEELEYEAPDEESESSFETQDEGEYETGDEELEAGTDEEYEAGEEMEYEGPDEESVDRLAERLYEFGTTQYESEYEADERLATILNEAERDFFFKKLKKKKGFFKGLLNKGLAKLTKKFPIAGPLLKVGSSLLRGDFKGALGSLVKSGLLKSALSLIPGAGPVITALEPALKAAGVELEVPDTDEGRRQFARDVAYVTRESYDYLINKIADPSQNINLLNPLQTSDLARNALMYGLKQGKAAGRPSFGGRGNGSQMGKRRVRKIYIKRGQAAKIIAV